MESHRLPCVVALIAMTTLARTTGAQIAVRTATIQEHDVTRGETYTGAVTVENLTDKPAHVRLYLTDYEFTADSGARFSPPGSLARSNAKWVVVSGSELVIPARGTAPASYTVHVPAVDTLAGTYWTVLMVESIPDPQREPGRNEIAISTVLRYAVQIVSHAGTSDRSFRILDPKVTTNDDGTSTLQFDLHNDGRRGTTVRVRAELYDDSATKRGQFDQARGLLYPGTSVRQQFALGKLPSGRYKVLVTLDAGDDALFAGQFTFAR